MKPIKFLLMYAVTALSSFAQLPWEPWTVGEHKLIPQRISRPPINLPGLLQQAEINGFLLTLQAAPSVDKPTQFRVHIYAVLENGKDVFETRSIQYDPKSTANTAGFLIGKVAAVVTLKLEEIREYQLDASSHVSSPQ